MKIVIIDTSSNKEAAVTLVIKDREYKKTKLYDKNRAQIVLPMIQELLNEHDISFEDITEVKVNSGPGSFTGLRVGVSIANALGFFLKVPINGLPPGQLVEPIYT